MITTAIINLGYLLVSFIIDLFPAGSGFNTDVHTAASTIGGYLQIIDPIVPTASLFPALSILIVVELAIFGFKSLKWIVSHLPFVGGRG